MTTEYFTDGFTFGFYYWKQLWRGWWHNAVNTPGLERARDFKKNNNLQPPFSSGPVGWSVSLVSRVRLWPAAIPGTLPPFSSDNRRRAELTGMEGHASGDRVVPDWVLKGSSRLNLVMTFINRRELLFIRAVYARIPLVHWSCRSHCAVLSRSCRNQWSPRLAWRRSSNCIKMKRIIILVMHKTIINRFHIVQGTN